MKKRQLFLSSLLLFGLVSCGGGESGIVCPVIPVPSSSSEPIPEESPLTLYEENSIVVGNSYGDGSCLALPTYRHKNHGELHQDETDAFVPDRITILPAGRAP